MLTYSYLCSVNLRKLNTIHYITNILNKTNMKKKQYEKPSVEVVELKQQSQLLAGSVNGDVNATMEDTWTELDI